MIEMNDKNNRTAEIILKTNIRSEATTKKKWEI